jgi:hypothetical protein
MRSSTGSAPIADARGLTLRVIAGNLGGFAHQSGGTVTAKSAVGGGTAITIYLPRSHASLTKPTEPIPIQPVASGQGTILIVEDNAEVADVTASLVEQLGYSHQRDSKEVRDTKETAGPSTDRGNRG